MKNSIFLIYFKRQDCIYIHIDQGVIFRKFAKIFKIKQLSKSHFGALEMHSGPQSDAMNGYWCNCTAVYMRNSTVTRVNYLLSWFFNVSIIWLRISMICLTLVRQNTRIKRYLYPNYPPYLQKSTSVYHHHVRMGVASTWWTVIGVIVQLGMTDLTVKRVKVFHHGFIMYFVLFSERLWRIQLWIGSIYLSIFINLYTCMLPDS